MLFNLFKSVLIYIMHSHCDCMSILNWYKNIVDLHYLRANGFEKWLAKRELKTEQNENGNERTYINEELVWLVRTANVLVRDQSERQKLSRSNMHITNKSGYSATRYNGIQEERIHLLFFNSRPKIVSRRHPAHAANVVYAWCMCNPVDSELSFEKGRNQK